MRLVLNKCFKHLNKNVKNLMRINLRGFKTTSGQRIFRSQDEDNHQTHQVFWNHHATSNYNQRQTFSALSWDCSGLECMSDCLSFWWWATFWMIFRVHWTAARGRRPWPARPWWFSFFGVTRILLQKDSTLCKALWRTHQKDFLKIKRLANKHRFTGS